MTESAFNIPFQSIARSVVGSGHTDCESCSQRRCGQYSVFGMRSSEMQW